MVDRRRTDGRTTPEYGYTISLSCEPYGKGELHVIKVMVSIHPNEHGQNRCHGFKHFHTYMVAVFQLF